MKVEITGFDVNVVPEDILAKLPEGFGNGVVVDAVPPTKDILLQYGVAEEDVDKVLTMMAIDRVVVVKGLDNFESDPLIIRGDDYKVIDNEGQEFYEPCAEDILNLLLEAGTEEEDE
ncbi:hypothetical protein R4004_002608 [Escherichia coli]|nr:hypothetical protein [Escherichia coli]